MTMSYASLTGGKTTPGSIINWTTYTRLDVGTVVDEAQSLLFQMLRCREMRSAWTFGMGIGQICQPLPPRFLDPVGRIYDLTNGMDYGQKIETVIEKERSYDPSPSGSLGTNPFTTTAGSSIVTVQLVAHDLTQGSTFTTIGAVGFDGLALLNGAFEIESIVDADHFTIDVGDLNNDAVATLGAVGGGAAATWTANKIWAGSQSFWTIWKEKVQFNSAFDTPATLKLLIYRRPRLLSGTNQTNFVTDRYPTLMRVASMASAANFMKDDTEYAKHVKALGELVGATAAENDLVYRGAEFGTDTP